MSPHFTLDEARALDMHDPLRAFRERFILPEEIVYLDGNSLGALPARSAARLREAVENEWGRGLIRSWNLHDWIGAPQRAGALIAPLIGAKASEVVVADSTSQNLFKLIVSAIRAAGGRGAVLTEAGNFPTDLYIAEGAVGLFGDCTLKVVPTDDLPAAIDDDVAVLVLTHVHYKTGARHDMAALTAAAQAKGALVIWDLSHSAGAIAVDLNGCNADMAIGCGYKYLNGGPGAPAFLFVAERHQLHLSPATTGWMGHAAPFQFRDDYQPAPGISRFLCGTPPVIALAALEESLGIFAEVDQVLLADKSALMCDLLIALVEERCAGFGFELITPRNPAARGSHVSFAHDEAHAICQALIARGVIGDFRAPDVLRFGCTPLYCGFEDIWRAVDTLQMVMATRAWDSPEHQLRQRVT